MGVHLNPFTSQLDIVDSPSGDFSDLTLDLGSATAPSISFDGDPNTGIYSPGADQVAISTNGTGRLFIDASGNVGIGDASPARDLEISSSTPIIRLTDSDGTDQYGEYGFSSGSLLIASRNNASNGPILFRGLGGGTTTEYARFSSSGHFGIGTSSPNSLLEVRGGEIRFGDASATATSVGRISYGGGTGELDLNAYSTGGSTLIKFFTSSSGTNAERARITSDGRLGLGTSSPATLLHVQQSADGEIFRVQRTGGTNLPILRVNLTEATPEAEIEQTGASAGDLGFKTGGQRRMTIASAGNVGIGTTSPGYLLDVRRSSAGDVVAFTGSTDGGRPLKFVSADNGIFLGAQWTRDIGSGGGIHAWAINGTERARIDSSGRLLVGTSSSGGRVGAKLQVVATGNEYLFEQRYANNVASGADLFLTKSRGSIASPAIVNNADYLSIIRFSGYDGASYLEAASIAAQVDGTPGANDMPGRLVFSVTADGSASPSEAMRINNAGELLVGYTSDNGAYKLQVNSQIFATSATIATSDGRYKENVAALNGCVDLVKALRPVSFDWKAQEPVTRVDEDGETVVVREAHNFPDGKQVGFIAQEVEAVLADKPWLGSVIKQNVRPAVTDNDGNELAPEEEFLGIAEGNLVAVLTSALKDAIGRIESLEAEVAALKA